MAYLLAELVSAVCAVPVGGGVGGGAPGCDSDVLGGGSVPPVLRPLVAVPGPRRGRVVGGLPLPLPLAPTVAIKHWRGERTGHHRTLVSFPVHSLCHMM